MSFSRDEDVEIFLVMSNLIDRPQLRQMLKKYFCNLEY